MTRVTVKCQMRDVNCHMYDSGRGLYGSSNETAADH